MYTRVAVLVLSFALAGSPLPGQRLASGPSSLIADWRPAADTRAMRFSQTDYRWEGAVFGSALAGITGAVLQAGACRRADGQAGNDCGGRTLVGGLIGAAAGGAVGFLVGSVIPKR